MKQQNLAEIIRPTWDYAQNDVDGGCIKSDAFLKDYTPKNDIILIVGTAPCAADDVYRFLEMAGEAKTVFDVGLVNYAAKIEKVREMIPDEDITHFFAADSHTVPMQELATGMPDNTIKHGVYIDAPGFEITWRSKKINWWSGTSSLFAVRAALWMGYCKIIIAGCPLDASGRSEDTLQYYSKLPEWTPSDDGPQDEKTDHTVHIWKWRECKVRPQFDLVRSLSGNTMRLFRRPTEEWLKQL